jgi:hypothetical protein
MNPQTESTISNSVVPHCQHRTPSGRRCRMAITDPDSGLCSKHAAEHQKDLDQADLAASLIGDIEEFRSASDINHSLGELYKLQARNKITPRRAAVLAYITNQLLHSHCSIHREHALELDGPCVVEPGDIPRPGDDGRRLIVDMPRPRRDAYETSDTMALLRNLNLSPPNATQPENASEKKLP